MVNSKHFLYPSTLMVSSNSRWITTILGSCVAVCLYDPVKKIGGMNHYMLPFWNGKGLASPKYGNIATEKLIEELVKMGSYKQNLIAKVFGGGNIFQGINTTYNVHQRNIAIARSILDAHGIPVIKSSVGGDQGRKIQFNPVSGKVLHKFIISSNQMQIVKNEK